MVPPPAPTPVRAFHEASAVVAVALRVTRDDVDVAAAARLFQADYDCCGGRVATMASSSARFAVATAAASAALQRRLHSAVDKDGNLVPALSQSKRRRTPGRAPCTPPRSKRRDATNTPLRLTPLRLTPLRLPRAVAVVVSSVAGPFIVSFPPQIQCNVTPPLLPSATAPARPRTSKSISKPKAKRAVGAAIGLTPKSSFLDWIHSSTLGSGPINERVQKREILDVRNQLFPRFGNRMERSNLSGF